MSCDDNVWLREQATANRVQNRLVDERLEQIHSQSGYNDFCCYFADSKTLQVRPASTHEMTGKNPNLCHGPTWCTAREFTAFRQSLKAVPLHMVVMQHDEDSLSDDAIKVLCADQANQGGHVLFTTRGRSAGQESSWEARSWLLDQFAWTHPVIRRTWTGNPSPL